MSLTKTKTFLALSAYFLISANLFATEEQQQSENVSDEQQEEVIHQIPSFAAQIPLVNEQFVSAVERYILDPESRIQLSQDQWEKEEDFKFIDGIAQISDFIREHDRVRVSALNLKKLAELKIGKSESSDDEQENSNEESTEEQENTETVGLKVSLSCKVGEGEENTLDLENLDELFPAKLNRENLQVIQYEPLKILLLNLCPQEIKVEGLGELGAVIGGMMNGAQDSTVGMSFSNYRNRLAKSAGKEVAADLGEALEQGLSSMCLLLGGIAKAGKDAEGQEQQGECTIM